MGEQYFMAFFSYLDQMQYMNDEQFGRVFRAAMMYARSGMMPEMDPLEMTAFMFIKWNIDKTSEKKSQTKEAKTNAANARWGKTNAKECTTMQSNAEDMHTDAQSCTTMQSNAEGMQNDANDPMKNKKEEEEEEEEIISISNEIDSAPNVAVRTPHKKIMELFNKTCTSFPQIQSIEGQRRLHVATHWKKHQSLDFFETLFKKAEASDFLTGRSGAWKANFDWIIKPSNVPKILEGNYDNKTAPKKEFEQSSFDTDEYMLSALKRTYGSEQEETEEDNG